MLGGPVACVKNNLSTDISVFSSVDGILHNNSKSVNGSGGYKAIGAPEVVMLKKITLSSYCSMVKLRI